MPVSIAERERIEHISTTRYGSARQTACEKSLRGDRERKKVRETERDRARQEERDLE